ncbi:MAG: YdeI/OmpD-associated family protein [Bacteroidia bacterium]|nr:YdeI/OmpD-associated family protein [Bacteroidia bacterium]
MNLTTKPTFFSSQWDFRKWLEKNHAKTHELFVGFYKVNSGKLSMTWSQSVDQAICFGWIDGIRKSIDDESYFIRFTPRKTSSIWSAINIKKVDDLSKQGLMHQAGLVSFSHRKPHKSKIYTYEKEPVKFSNVFEKKFRTNKKAWAFFQTLPPSYHNSAIDWVMNAKKEVTSIKRLDELINDSEAGRKIKRLRY